MAFQANLLTAQNESASCLEIIKENANLIISRDNTIQVENKIVKKLLSCKEIQFTRTELHDILGEPNDVEDFYDGIENAKFQSFVYFMKPTYESKYFIGQAIHFRFKEGETNCTQITSRRYCE